MAPDDELSRSLRSATDHAADDTADHGADRTGSPLTVPCTSLDPARDPLGLRQRRNGEDSDNGSGSE